MRRLQTKLLMDEKTQKPTMKMLFGAECPLLAHPTIFPMENPIEPTPAVASHQREETRPTVDVVSHSDLLQGPE